MSDDPWIYIDAKYASVRWSSDPNHVTQHTTQYYSFLDKMQTIIVVAYKDVDRQETRPSEDWNYLREQKVCILMNEGITSNALYQMTLNPYNPMSLCTYLLDIYNK